MTRLTLAATLLAISLSGCGGPVARTEPANTGVCEMVSTAGGESQEEYLRSATAMGGMRSLISDYAELLGDDQSNPAYWSDLKTKLRIKDSLTNINRKPTPAEADVILAKLRTLPRASAVAAKATKDAADAAAAAEAKAQSDRAAAIAAMDICDPRPLVDSVRRVGTHIAQKASPSAWSNSDMPAGDFTGIYVDGDNVFVWGPGKCAFSADQGSTWRTAPSGHVAGVVLRGRGYGLSADGQLRSWDGFSYSGESDLPAFYALFRVGDQLVCKSKTKAIWLSTTETGVSVVRKDDIGASRSLMFARKPWQDKPAGIISWDPNAATNKALFLTTNGDQVTISWAHPLPNFRLPADWQPIGPVPATDPTAMTTRDWFDVGGATVGNGVRHEWQSSPAYLGLGAVNLSVTGDVAHQTATIYDEEVRGTHPASASLPDGTRQVAATNGRLFAVGAGGVWTADRR